MIWPCDGSLLSLDGLPPPLTPFTHRPVTSHPVTILALGGGAQELLRALCPMASAEPAWLSALPMTVPPRLTGPRPCLAGGLPSGAADIGHRTSLHWVISGPLPFCSFLLPSLLVMLLFQDSTSSGSFLLCVPVPRAFLPRTHQQLVSFSLQPQSF